MLIGKTLERKYKIIKQLGKAMNSNIYLAEDASLIAKPNRVIKHLFAAHTLTNPETIERANKLFEDKIKVLYTLGEYSQIQQLYLSTDTVLKVNQLDSN